MSGVAIVGSHVFGVYMTCERLPGPGETVLGRDFVGIMPGDGGKGSNQAVCCAKLGGRTAFVGKVGDDQPGRDCVTMLGKLGVNTEHLVETKHHPTGASIILLDAEGVSSIAIDPGANNDIQELDLGAARDVIARYRVLLTQFELPTHTVRAATKLGRELELTTILNPAPVPPNFSSAFGDIDVVTPNKHEAHELLGRKGRGTPVEMSKELVNDLGVRNAVITLGSRGVAATCDGQALEIPGLPVRQVNSVGAGDAFNAALASALSVGFNWEDSIRFGSGVGAFTVSNERPPWFAYPDPDELLAFLEHHDSTLKKLTEEVIHTLSAHKSREEHV